MTTLAPPDDGIPVLTDVVETGSASEPPQRLDTTLQLSALAWADAGAAAHRAAASAHADAGPDPLGNDDEWLETVAMQVQARVLGGLSRRIDPIVEQRLREAITGLLEQVLAGMTAELKVTAQTIVRDAVAQAVAAELAGMQKPGKTPP